jgi:hypothetical protein
MPAWRGDYWLPTEAAEQPGVSARTVEGLLPPAANPSNRGWLVGWPGGEDRRATCLMVHSATT